MNNLGPVIVIVIMVVFWIVKALASMTGNDEQAKKDQGKGRSLEEWDELQARRRAEMARQNQQLETMRGDVSQPDPSKMTMAQRIELARQRARQQGGGMGGQGDDAGEALRRARERAEQEAQRRRVAAEQQRQAQIAQRQQAERERAVRARDQQVAERRRLAEQRAKAEQEQLRRSRSRRRSSSQATPTASKPVPVLSSIKSDEVRDASYKRVHKGHGHGGPELVTLKKTKNAHAATALGPLDTASLRKAFIMKELLDKPVALRSPQDDLLS